MPGDDVKKLLSMPWLRAGAALLLPLLLAACSRDGDDSAQAAVPQTTITALVWAPDWPDEMQQIAAEFSKENPAIRVNLQFMIGNSVEANVKPKVASNNLPDFISLNPNAYAAGLAEQGLLADLSHTVAWNNMLDSLKGDWTSGRQQHFGIAGGVAATLVYYNKEMFARAGISAPPTDFEQFLQVCERLKQAGFTPIMWNGGFPNTLGNGPFSSAFANNIVARTPDWKRRIGDGSLDLDNPDGADIFAKIRLLPERGYVQKDYMSTGYDEGIRLFTEGKTAMAFHGTWASGLLMHGKGFRTGVFVPPWNAPGKTAVPVIGSETGFAVCETRNKAAAIKFLEFMFGRGFAIQQNKRQNIAPLKIMQGKIVSDSQITAYIAGVSAYPLTASPYYSFLPAGTIDMLHPLLQEVLLAKTTPQQAAASLGRSIRQEAQRQNK